MDTPKDPVPDSGSPGPEVHPAVESTSARRREERSRRRKWVMAGVGLLVTAGIGVGLVLPAFRLMRGRQYAAEASDLLQGQKYEQSFAKVLAALQLAPRDPAVVRTAATLCAETGSPNGLRYFESLVSMGAATAEDRAAYARLALALKRTDVAGRELGLLLKANPTNLEYLHLLARQQLESRDSARATRTAGYALSLRPDDLKTQLLYGSLLLKSRTNSVRATGRRMLWGIALGEGPAADSAAEALMTSQELTPAELRLLMRDFRSRTNARPVDLLRAQELALRLEPGRTNALVRELFDQLTSTNSSVDLLAMLGRWALEKNQPDLVLERVTADRAQTNGTLGSLRGFALIQTGRWNELLPMIDDPDSALDAVIRNVLRAEMALRTGKPAEAELAFRAAAEQPKAPPDRILLVARSAEAAGFPRIAVSAYQRLSGVPGQSVPAALEALRVLGPVDDMGLVRDTLKKLNELLPGDDTVAGERAWAELLMSSRVKESREVAERLRQAQPDEVQWRFLLALARLREDRAPDALVLMEADVSNWAGLKPRWQAVFVAALGANQQREAARTYAGRMNLSGLRSVEKDLVKPYLAD